MDIEIYSQEKVYTIERLLVDKNIGLDIEIYSQEKVYTIERLLVDKNIGLGNACNIK